STTMCTRIVAAPTQRRTVDADTRQRSGSPPPQPIPGPPRGPPALAADPPDAAVPAAPSADWGPALPFRPRAGATRPRRGGGEAQEDRLPHGWRYRRHQARRLPGRSGEADEDRPQKRGGRSPAVLLSPGGRGLLQRPECRLLRPVLRPLRSL